MKEILVFCCVTVTLLFHGIRGKVFGRLLSVFDDKSMCSGELFQMVECPLSMREVPGSIPGFSKGRENICSLLQHSLFFLSFASSFLSLFLLYFSYVKCYLRGLRLLSSCTKPLTALMGPWNRSWCLAVLQSLCYFLLLVVLGERSLSLLTAGVHNFNDLSFCLKHVLLNVFVFKEIWIKDDVKFVSNFFNWVIICVHFDYSLRPSSDVVLLPCRTKLP